MDGASLCRSSVPPDGSSQENNVADKPHAAFAPLASPLGPSGLKGHNAPSPGKAFAQLAQLSSVLCGAQSCPPPTQA
jgi:hypothetical protein